MGKVAGLAVLSIVVAASAMITKHFSARSGSPALVVMEPAIDIVPEATFSLRPPQDPLLNPAEVTVPDPTPAELDVGAGSITVDELVPGEQRFFDGRPVKPVKTMTMVVTAYSPDSRSCGDSADGITASNHAVFTNAYRLVAADSRVLPLGSIISVPGYDSGNLVPVLDRGGAIKGLRLDVLFPTHEIARQWGVRTVKVTVWEYADGGGNAWRKIRDSKQ